MNESVSACMLVEEFDLDWEATAREIVAFIQSTIAEASASKLNLKTILDPGIITAPRSS